MNRTIALTVIALVFLCSPYSHAEKCDKKYLEEMEYTDIECQFYMGTAAYRHEIYSVAASHWKYILETPIKYARDAEIKAMALSTLTFLTYNGLGVEQDRAAAVDTWKQVVKKGGFEARRHLGAAYSDDNFKYRDPVQALGWYESIFLLYPNHKDLSESDQSIYLDAKREVKRLKALLSSEEQSKALHFAKSTM
ncbi:hypothetical protein ACJJI4_08160 [Microbulbifer sp. TRSA002]|uniref:hypothetical protein n=1 Tax=Microbulbifer sp. TRSA002 TaxID=3243382 RepID=UPI004039A95B